MERKIVPKHIVVSGGSRGLGLALVEDCLRAGYRVSAFARGTTPEAKSLADSRPNDFYFSTVDITDHNALSLFVRSAISRFGEVYGLLNNSAVAVDGVLATMPEVEICRMIDINLAGSIRLTRLCLRSQLKTRLAGRIINISSIIGTRGYSGLSTYSATKAGLDGFTRSLAREVGRAGITVNSVAPGYMRTTMSSGLNDVKLGQIVRRTPMGRLAEISDVSPLVQFLLSDAASFITGQTILIDGGISA